MMSLRTFAAIDNRYSFTYRFLVIWNLSSSFRCSDNRIQSITPPHTFEPLEWYFFCHKLCEKFLSVHFSRFIEIHIWWDFFSASYPHAEGASAKWIETSWIMQSRNFDIDTTETIAPYIFAMTFCNFQW